VIVRVRSCSGVSMSVAGFAVYGTPGSRKSETFSAGEK
jgi:hypothetical protein